MKQYYVYLTYMSLTAAQRVVVEAYSADHARILAASKYPNAQIRGPSAVMEIKPAAQPL